MLPYRDSKLTKIVLILFFVLMFGYGYFEARGFLLGPSIHIDTAVTTVSEPFIRIKGQAQRISSLSMNGRSIPVTEDGSFDQPYLLSNGLNRIVFDAKDTYGRANRAVVQIVYQPLPEGDAQHASSTSPIATSTVATSTAP